MSVLQSSHTNYFYFLVNTDIVLHFEDIKVIINKNNLKLIE